MASTALTVCRDTPDRRDSRATSFPELLRFPDSGETQAFPDLAEIPVSQDFREELARLEDPGIQEPRAWMALLEPPERTVEMGPPDAMLTRRTPSRENVVTEAFQVPPVSPDRRDPRTQCLRDGRHQGKTW